MNALSSPPVDRSDLLARQAQALVARGDANTLRLLREALEGCP